MKKNILPIAIVFILLFILGIVLYFFGDSLSLTPNARVGISSNNKISIANSYVFASPVRAKARSETVRATAFILDEEGRGVFNEAVKIIDPSGRIHVSEIQALTDETGMVLFDINSDYTGTFFLEVYVGSKLLSQQLKVVFD